VTLIANWSFSCNAEIHGQLTLILVDLHRFKKYNDSYGHRLGNELLQSAGQIFRDAVRFGGDEFAIVLPETDLEQSWHIVKRIRHSFGSLPNRSAVTLSMGVVIYREEPLHEFFDRADHLLCDVKANGGNGCQSELSGGTARKTFFMTAL
jgi:diguanylate cyclase (GGDEF)-like protein